MAFEGFGGLRWWSWGAFWFQVGGLGATWGYLGLKLEVLGPSWLQVGRSWGHLGSNWGVLRPSWLQLQRSWGHLGSNLGGLGAILAPSCRVLGSSWLQLGGSWGHLGSNLEVLGTMLGGFGGHVGVVFGIMLQVCRYSKNLKNI